jgi:hypothetical protein
VARSQGEAQSLHSVQGEKMSELEDPMGMLQGEVVEIKEVGQ